MLPLAELQHRVRQAVVAGDDHAISPLLVGGADGRKRLAIHRRHYHASLAGALIERFPTTRWLAGSALVTDAAKAFVVAHPPSRPCLAEYGEEFPAFLGARVDAAVLPYLRAFAELEWHLARLSLAVTAPALTVADLQSIDPSRLADLSLALQPDVAYVHAAWALDELMRVYLSDCAPDRFVLHDADVWLELRGARGGLQVARLERAAFVFRERVWRGQTLAEAAMSACEIDSAFDAGGALSSLIADGLVTAARAPEKDGDA